MTDKQGLPLRRTIALLFAFALTACALGSSPTQPQGQAMVVAANPHAADAGLTMLRAGGSAVDAAIAAELVLGLVEPQSSGLGGGGFLLHYNGGTKAIVGYDGREQAPAGATPDMFIENGREMAFLDAQTSGRSTGTPSLVAMLKLAHEEHGRLPWAQLFEPAIALAENGFAVSPRLNRLISMYGARTRLRDDPTARAYFFDASGNAWPVGHVLRNPEYARTLRAIAAQGPRALSEGPMAEAIVATVRRAPRAGTLTLADLQNYRPRRVDVICGAYRVYRVCSAGAPASGSAVVEILGLYERARPQPGNASNVDDWAAFMWASRLAYADRDHYIADPTAVPVPGQELVAPSYLDQRARMIDLAQAPARTQAGVPAGVALFERWGRETSTDAPGTTHLSVVDAQGNAVALTATVESGFGSQRMVAGFVLNNQLTDFSFRREWNGRPVANAVAPGKRPRSSMVPTIITDRDGRLVMVAGSPGGSSIVAYTARTIIGVLDWRQTPQDAVSTGNVVARFAPARVESERLTPEIAAGLRARGWALQENASEESGLHVIHVTPQGLEGGADPRREGVVRRLN